MCIRDRLVTLGADDAQPTEVDDLGVLVCDLALDVRQGRGPLGLVLVRVLDRIDAALLERHVGEELGVAAEHDVGASSGHVGGDGDACLLYTSRCV